MSKKDNDRETDGGEEQTREIPHLSDESKETRQVQIGTDRSKTEDKRKLLPGVLCHLLLYLCTIIAITYVPVFIIIGLWLCSTFQMDISIKPAEPIRIQGRKKIVKWEKRRNHSRIIRHRDTCSWGAFRSSTNNSMVRVKRMQNKRINPRHSKETEKTTPYQESFGYSTQDKNKVICTSTNNAKSFHVGKSPVSRPGNEMIDKDDSHCKTLHEQESMTYVKEIDDSDDINTYSKEIYGSDTKCWKYSNTFQTIQHPVVSYCTQSYESGDSQDGDPPDNSTAAAEADHLNITTQPTQVSNEQSNESDDSQNRDPPDNLTTAEADHLNNETQPTQASDENYIDVISLREHRPTRQNDVIDLDQVRYSQYRMVSILHMRQLQATLNNLHENRSQENASNQRAMIVDLALNRGPMTDLRQSRSQNGQTVAIDSSHGGGTCLLCGSQLARIWCHDCPAWFCVDHDILHHGQNGRQRHRRRTF